jgi:hypothetical protein
MQKEVTINNFPETPFSIYFLRDSEVSPKRMFTVTRINLERKRLYVGELDMEINCEQTLISIVQCFGPN